MDKHSLIASLAKMTANLSPSSQRETYLLKRLRTELGAWLVRNHENAAIEALNTSVDEQTLPEDLKQELSDIIDVSLSTSRENVVDFRIVKRDPSSEITLGETVPSIWNQGQQPAYTLGPFLDEYDRLSWFDFYKPLQLSFASYIGEATPFLKFNWSNLLPTGVQPEINLGPGSIWIKANYLNPLAPANSFVGLKIESGQIRFNEEFSFSGGNIFINPSTVCQLNLTLSTSQIPINNNIQAGRDALEASVNLPRDVSIQFTFRNGSFQHISDSHLRLYENEYDLAYQQVPVVYENKLQRIAMPLKTPSNTLDIQNFSSTLFQPSEKANIDRIFWALPLTIDDHNKLGEASGCGGFLLKTDVGLKADWMNLQNGPVALKETSWIAEPGKIELHALRADAASANQRFNLWWEDRVEKRSSVSINFLKNAYIKYFCLAADEIEVILTDVNLKGHFDKPLTTDGKRIKSKYTNVQYGLGQYKQDTFLQCVSSQNLQKKIESKQFDELKPLSIALSNAFFKISPCDEFVLTGRVEQNDSVVKGVCSFQFGLYSFIPIFPDPYVTNIQLNLERRRSQIPGREPLSGELQVSVNWLDIADPQLNFRIRSLGGELFSKIEPQGGTIYRKLKDKNSENRISHILSTTDDHGSVIDFEVRASDLIEEDEDNDRTLKGYFQELSGGSPFPDLYVLDVSGNADQFGVGLSHREIDRSTYEHNFKFKGIEFLSPALNLHVITLPPVQWEAVKTIQNPNVKPYPFPSPAHSLDTGDPAVLSQIPSYDLVPVTPHAAINNLIASFKDIYYQENRRSAGYFNLPFGMKSLLRLEQFFSMGTLSQNVMIEFNQPHFRDVDLSGGAQISLSAISLDKTLNESPGFAGATIQTRNLLNSSNDVLGLSVLGFVVDTIFNNEFKPGGEAPRVPLKRIDLSGYGASTFSDWRNPDAQIATTSQTRFEVFVGRTSHEVVQVKSMLYCCGASVVRTITIQRTAGGGVTRHDSGWVAEGPGLFDFSFRLKGNPNKEPNPYTFHLGLVKGYYRITNIKDTARIIEIPPIEAGDKKAKLQEVIFDTDILIEDVTKGQTNGFVPSKGQKGYVQLEPSGEPISEGQLKELLLKEGPIGGPVDCVINVAQSPQEMRVVRVDTNRKFGSTAFVNALRGSLILPNEGAWAVVRSENNHITFINNNTGLPLIRLNGSMIYEFTEPAEDINNGFGLMHASRSHRTLFLKPAIQKSTNLITTLQPYFADFYAMAGTNNIFPDLNLVFPVGAGNGMLKIHGSGLLELTSSGKVNVSSVPRLLRADANVTSYVEYFDSYSNLSPTHISIDPNAEKKWTTEMKSFKLVYDVEGHKRVKIFHLNFYASDIDKPKIDKPRSEYGNFLKPMQDMLQFFGKTDMGEFDADFSNEGFFGSSERKWKLGVVALITFYTYKLFPFHYGKIQIGPAKVGEFPKKWDDFVDNNGNRLPTWEQLAGGPIPEVAWFKGKIGFMIYEKTEHGESKAGFTLKISAEMGVMAISFLEIAAGYALGIVECNINFSPEFAGKSFSFKVALGFQGKVKISELVEAEGSRAVGTEYESEKKLFFAVLIQELKLTVATISLGATVEGKAPVRIKDMLDDPLTATKETLADFELTLIIEISVAYVINFEQSFTWKEITKIF